jgi:hypothetical protein
LDSKNNFPIFKAENFNENLMLRKILLILFIVLCAGTWSTMTGQTVVTLQPGAEDGKDAVLSDLSHNVNHGDIGENTAMAWTSQGTPFINRALIEFDLSFMPQGSQHYK